MGLRTNTHFIKAALYAALLFTGACIAHAQTDSFVAGFEGLPTGKGAAGSPVGTYDDLNWTGLNAYSSSRLPNAFTGSGIETGTQAAYNNGGGAASITLATGYSFSLTSFYMSEGKSYGSSGLRVAFIGYSSTFASGSSELIYTTASDASPQLFNSNWTGLTRLDIYAVDANGNQYNGATASEFRLDDVTYTVQTGTGTGGSGIQPVPEPSSWAGLGAALGGVALMLRPRRRTRKS